ncbi:MAG: terminase small subunit, partial [Methyloligellaceae bacterium]
MPIFPFSSGKRHKIMDSQDLTASPAANALAPSGAPTDAPDDALAAPLKPLTPRQERFCHYFVAYANAAHAAREAGFSPKSAKHQGYRLLRTGRVRARIRALHAELARDHAGNADALIGKLENLYRRATDAKRFHTATRAVENHALRHAVLLIHEGAAVERVVGGCDRAHDHAALA